MKANWQKMLASSCCLAVLTVTSLNGCVVGEHDHEDHDHQVFVDPHGFHHEGYYDEHHDWHGGYYDEGHQYRDDPHDWQHP
jgi:hypothetical protein